MLAHAVWVLRWCIFFWTFHFLSTCAYYISKLQGSFFSSGAEGARTRWCTGIGWGQHPALATWTWSIDLTRRRAGALPAYTRRVGTVFSWSFPGCCVFPRILKAVATWIESTHAKQAEVHMQKRTYSTSMFAKCIWYFGNTGHVGYMTLDPQGGMTPNASVLRHFGTWHWWLVAFHGRVFWRPPDLPQICMIQTEPHSLAEETWNRLSVYHPNTWPWHFLFQTLPSTLSYFPLFPQTTKKWLSISLHITVLPPPVGW